MTSRPYDSGRFDSLNRSIKVARLGGDEAVNKVDQEALFSPMDGGIGENTPLAVDHDDVDDGQEHDPYEGMDFIGANELSVIADLPDDVRMRMDAHDTIINVERSLKAQQTDPSLAAISSVEVNQDDLSITMTMSSDTGAFGGKRQNPIIEQIIVVPNRDDPTLVDMQHVVIDTDSARPSAHVIAVIEGAGEDEVVDVTQQACEDYESRLAKKRNKEMLALGVAGMQFMRTGGRETSVNFRREHMRLRRRYRQWRRRGFTGQRKRPQSRWDMIAARERSSVIYRKFDKLLRFMKRR